MHGKRVSLPSRELVNDRLDTRGDLPFQLRRVRVDRLCELNRRLVDLGPSLLTFFADFVVQLGRKLSDIATDRFALFADLVVQLRGGFVDLVARRLRLLAGLTRELPRLVGDQVARRRCLVADLGRELLRADVDALLDCSRLLVHLVVQLLRVVRDVLSDGIGRDADRVFQDARARVDVLLDLPSDVPDLLVEDARAGGGGGSDGGGLGGHLDLVALFLDGLPDQVGRVLDRRDDLHLLAHVHFDDFHQRDRARAARPLECDRLRESGVEVLELVDREVRVVRVVAQPRRHDGVKDAQVAHRSVAARVHVHGHASDVSVVHELVDGVEVDDRLLVAQEREVR